MTTFIKAKLLNQMVGQKNINIYTKLKDNTNMTKLAKNI